LPELHSYFLYFGIKYFDDYGCALHFCYKTTRQVRNDYTINLGGGYVQLLKGKSPLPRPKQEVIVTKRFNNEMHIYYNDQELLYNELENRPMKKGYKIIKMTRDHPWRKMNNRIPGGQHLIGTFW